MKIIKIINSLIIFGLIILISGIAEAQDVGEISGTVMDPNSNPISGAMVTIVEIESSEKTDIDGVYHIYDLEIGNYTIQVTAEGYESREVFVSLDENTTVVTLDFLLYEIEKEDEEISIIFFISLIIIVIIIFVFIVIFIKFFQKQKRKQQQEGDNGGEDEGGSCDEDEEEEDITTDKPHEYSIDELPETCSPKFIVRINPPICDLKKIKRKEKYFGELCYLIFPGSEWEGNSPIPRIKEAQAIYQKYCIFLNFKKVNLSDEDKNRLRKWYEGWYTRIFNDIFKPGHLKNLKKGIKAQNPTASDEEIDRLYQESIELSFNRTHFKKGFITEFIDEMIKLNRDYGCGNNKTLVVFMNQYICNNGALVRSSATERYFNQIGINAADINSKNILTHELAHLLGKKSRVAGGELTWWHNQCENAILHQTRGEWYIPNSNMGDHLSIPEYQEICKNAVKTKLLEEVK